MAENSKLIAGSANVINEALVEREKFVFPPVYIKLGLINQFVKALNKDGDCVKYLRTRFHRLSDEKVKSGIFTGPDIRKLLKDPEFTAFMMDTEYDAWQAFVSVVKDFLGNRRDDNFVNLVNSLLEDFHNQSASKFIFCIATWMRSQKTLETSRMSRVNGFIRIFKRWKTVTKEGMTQKCWQTTVGA